MKKRVYFFFFSLSLCILAINFYFQKHPGYMDAEYYFLGGKYLAQNSTKAPFLWNYLDNPTSLPHPLFTYWKPLASVITAIPMKIFGSTSFQSGRIFFYLLASFLSPLAVYISYQITKNKFTSLVTGFLIIFSGYYFKLLTIPETITPYLLFGGLYFLTAFQIISSFLKNKLKRKLFFIGLLSGLLTLTRVDGILFIGFSLVLILLLAYKSYGINFQSIPQVLSYCLICVFGFSLVLLPDFGLNYYHTGSIFSPVGIKAIWINTYDDTFIFPSSQLTMDYWLSDGWANKIQHIKSAFLLNLGTLSAVQLNIFGVPLFGFGVWRYRKEFWLRFFLFVSISIFLFMTILFPLAGSRGGYLHSGASLQLINWLLISAGFYEFLLWGINKRNWKLTRSKIMFGTALLLFSIIYTFSAYYRDVIGNSNEGFVWNSEYQRYAQIEAIISDHSKDKSEVVLINNPVGYHYQTGRWAIVLPNAEQDQVEEIIKNFDVRFFVVDKNIPIKMLNTIDSINNIKPIGAFPDNETTIYEIIR